MQKVLDAVMEGPDWGKNQGNTVVVLVDVNPGVSHLLDAFVSRRAALRIPMHYAALVDNHSHADWVRQVKGRELVDKHRTGELQVVGHPMPDAEMPAELLEELPTPPLLNKLVIVGRKLMVPKDLSDTWTSNTKFQAQFKDMTEALAAELGDSWTAWDLLPSEQQAASPNKRSVGEVEVSPAKKAKVGGDKVIEQHKMVGGEDLFCTQVLGGKPFADVFLVIKPGHHIYVVNRPPVSVELPEGFVLVGFGRGLFKFRSKEPDANPETHISLSLVDSSTRVVLDNKVKTLGVVVQEKRKSDPSPKVMYHRMEDVPGGSLGSFRLEMVNEVLFGLLEQDVPKDSMDGKELLINRVGALIPTHYWRSHCLDIIWAMKWTPTGLQAVRPVVCLTQGAVLPPGHALACN
jgi:hypothetical protein